MSRSDFRGRSGGMADARDLKSLVKYLTYGFESRLRHEKK